MKHIEVLAVPPTTPDWWTETGATWASHTAGVSWASGPGGDFDSKAAATLELSTSGSARYYSFDVTAIVDAWVKGLRANNGFLIKVSDIRAASGIHCEVFDSYEGTNGPYMRIEYYYSESGLFMKESQDTTIKQAYPGSNYSSEQTIMAGGLSGDIHRALVQFDLSSLPKNIQVSSARVQLKLYAKFSNSQGVQVDMHAVTNTPWCDRYTTWVSRTANTLWPTPGGNYDPAILSSVTFSNNPVATYYS